MMMMTVTLLNDPIHEIDRHFFSKKYNEKVQNVLKIHEKRFTVRYTMENI